MGPVHCVGSIKKEGDEEGGRVVGQVAILGNAEGDAGNEVHSKVG